MPLIATTLTVATVGSWAAYRWLASGSYRRPDEDGPLPRHHWVIAAIPLLTAALCWSATGEPYPAALVMLLLAPVGVTLATVDADVHRLPNALTLPFAGTTLALLLLAATTSGRWDDLQRAALALLVVGGGLLLVSLLLRSGGIGVGDAKLMLSLAPILGWHGWNSVLAGVYVAFLLGALVALTLLATRRAHRSTHIAYSPYLIVGTVIALLTHATLTR